MQRIALFGAGGELKKFITIISCSDFIIEMVVDNCKDKWGTMEYGYVIKSPEKLWETDGKIIISSTYKNQIYVQLEQMGLQERVIPVEHVIAPIHDSDITLAGLPNIVFDTIFGVGWGGMEMWSYRVGRALADRGWNVSIYGEVNQEKQDRIYEDLIRRFTIWNIDDTQAVRSLYDSLKQKLPLILIDNWTEHLFIAAWMLRLQYPDKVKIISVLHNDEESLYRVKKLWESSFDYILAVSKKIQNHLIDDFSFAKEKVIYRPNFLHYKTGKFRKDINHGSRIRIGWGARIEERQKRADLLIPLIQGLEQTGIDYVLTIAGDGTYKEILELWVKTNGFSDKILFPGYIYAEKMKSFWASQDIYISLSDYEGFSLAMIEAMANGAVPVVTNVSGTEDFIQDGVSGYLIHRNSPEEATRKIADLYHDRVKLCDISHHAIKIVNEKCDFDQYIEFMDRCLDGICK